MKNEIIHGKIISVEDMLDYEEEYRSRNGSFLFGLRERIFVNCVFKNMGFLSDFVIRCTFKNCIFENITFGGEWLDKKIYNNIFENCMFFKCNIFKNCESDMVDAIPESTNMRCPRYDKIIGYKIITNYNYCRCLLATLEIPAGVKRSSAIGNKCRCEYAKVLSIIDENGNKYDIGKSAITGIDNQLTYKVGEYVYADSFDENRFNECAPGIHFFMTPEEAWDYVR
jgi:hypothetical protein